MVKDGSWPGMEKKAKGCEMMARRSRDAVLTAMVLILLAPLFSW
jgi:lipopolysaccharide/colanic/teichoic acid biosynthesis glycosyltransferase